MSVLKQESYSAFRVELPREFPDANELKKYYQGVCVDLDDDGAANFVYPRFTHVSTDNGSIVLVVNLVEVFPLERNYTDKVLCSYVVNGKCYRSEDNDTMMLLLENND